MEKTEIIVGLDIGTTKICSIVGKQNEYGKIDVLGMGTTSSEGLSRGVVTNIDKTVESITKAVKDATSRSDVEIKVVNVGIAGHHIRSVHNSTFRVRTNPDEEIRQSDVDVLINDMYQLITKPGEQILHVLPQEFKIDKETGIKDPIGMAGLRMEGFFHVISGNVNAAKNINRCVEKSSLEMDSMILEPIASSQAVLSEEEKEAGVALVDIGGGSTDIAIFQDGIIRHTAAVPFGGNIITRDIKEGCNVMQKQAEKLKIQYGSAVPEETNESEIIVIPGLKGREPKEISTKNLSYIIEARVAEIFETVFHEIKSSGYENKLIGGIVVTGGGAALNHIAQAVEFHTGMDTRIGYPNEHLANGMTQEVNNPKFSTAIGLIIEGFNKQNVPEKEQNNQESEQPKKKNWFENIFRKGKRWLEDDDLDDFDK